MNKSPLRIAVISKSDASGGGASRIAQQIVELLQDEGHRVEHHVAYAPEFKAHMRPLHQARGLTRLDAHLRSLSRRWGLPDLIGLDYLIFRTRTRMDVDLVHVHDISGAFSPFSLSRLAKRVPLVWTFHDCSPFTGGCIAALECEAFRTRCRDCPQLGKWPLDTQIDRTGFLQDIKRRAANDYAAVTPSQWLADMAMSSGMFDTQPSVIPHSVDSGLFRPLDRKSIRRVLGVPEDRFVILLASGYIQDRFKGFSHALATLHRIEKLRPFVLVVGRNNQAVLEALAPFDMQVTGYISDDRLLAQFYAAPDVMLYPSLAESFGLAVLEAQACGTPVVGFASGAIPEIVSHLETGWLSPVADTDGLVAGLRHVSQYPDDLQRWGRNARRRALERFSRKRFLEAYLAVYRRVLDGELPTGGQ